MFADVTMPPKSPIPAQPSSDIQSKKEKTDDVKKSESLGGFRSHGSIGFSWHAFLGVGNSGSRSI